MFMRLIENASVASGNAGDNGLSIENELTQAAQAKISRQVRKTMIPVNIEISRYQQKSIIGRLQT
jgi:hypothetical protein